MILKKAHLSNPSPGIRTYRFLSGFSLWPLQSRVPMPVIRYLVRSIKFWSCLWIWRQDSFPSYSMAPYFLKLRDKDVFERLTLLFFGNASKIGRPQLFHTSERS